jgi:predicted Zn-dependent peptidase
VLGRESNRQKALQLAHAVVMHKGDAAKADGDFDVFMSITAADVRRVARMYFTPQNRTVLTILPVQGRQ